MVAALETLPTAPSVLVVFEDDDGRSLAGIQSSQEVDADR